VRWREAEHVEHHGHLVTGLATPLTTTTFCVFEFVPRAFDTVSFTV
jgi:hypothetical protein